MKNFTVEKQGRHNGKTIWGVRCQQTGNLKTTTYSNTGAKLIAKVLENEPNLTGHEAYQKALESI